jgi:tight adherence protein B
MTLVISALVAASAFFAVRALLPSPKHEWLQARLAPHVGPRPVATAPAAPESERVSLRSRLHGVAEGVERRLGVAGPWRRFASLAERAAVPLRPVELGLAIVGAGLALALLLAGAGAPALGGLVALFTPLLGLLWLSARARRRTRAFEDQLSEVLRLLASSLKAGHSFSQALQGVAEDSEEPARSEFARVLTESRLGRPLDEALDSLGARMRSEELDFVLGAVRVQRQVGGSLAGLFDIVSETIRQRQQFARKVRALTSMGRMSAIVLVALPFVMAALLTAMSPRYMEPLWTTGIGRLLAAGSVASIAVGGLVIKQIVNIRG